MKLVTNWYTKFLILAILLRLLVMPFFFHPDIKTYHFQSSFLQKGVWNIYSYLPEHKAELPLKEEFVYFPLTYFTLGFYQIIASPFLGPDFNSWLANASAAAVDTIGVFRYLFILKLPYLFLDCAVAFLLTKFFDDEFEKKRVFLLWLFNPFSIIIVYIFSNVDIFPVFLSVLSLYFSRQKKYPLAGLMLGLGAGFKAFPLLFVPFLFFAAKNWKEKIIILLTSIIPFILIIAPFLKSAGFQEATLNSGLTTRIISNGISIGFGEMLYPGIMLLAVIYFLAWQRKINFNQIPFFCFSVILAIFMTIHFHIQWLLWPMPFAILMIGHKKEWAWSFVVIMLLAVCIPVLYDDPSMTVSTLSVINPLFETLPTPFKMVQKIYDPIVLQSILHSSFFGLGLLTIWQVFKEEKI